MSQLEDVMPNEREALRVGGYLVDRLLRQFGADPLWKNEFSVQTVMQLRDWLAVARLRLQLDSDQADLGAGSIQFRSTEDGLGYQ